MNLNNLPDELKEKAKTCESASELLALAEHEGIELTDEQLEAVSGGVLWDCESHGYVPSGGNSWGTV